MEQIKGITARSKTITLSPSCWTGQLKNVGNMPSKRCMLVANVASRISPRGAAWRHQIHSNTGSGVDGHPRRSIGGERSETSCCCRHEESRAIPTIN